MSLFKPREQLPLTVEQQTDVYLQKIKHLYDNGKTSGTTLTLVIRSPSLKGPVVFSNDTPEEAIAAIRRVKAAQLLVRP